MMRKKILVVDDERDSCEPIGLLLAPEYTVQLAFTGKDALLRFTEDPPDVVLLDLKMPGMDGLDVLRQLKHRDPDVEVIMLTGYASMETVRHALVLGAFDYLIKPPSLRELQDCIARAVIRRVANLQRAALLVSLQHDHQTLTRELEQARVRMISQVHETVYALLKSLQLRDAYSGYHSMAVMWLINRFAWQLHLTHEERTHLRCAALVHDLGKIALPEDILNKPEPLLPSDIEILQSHPLLSVEIISSVAALAELVPTVRAHHEQWDGQGYPDHLVGEAIPWQAQLLALCDTVHAMSSTRCYRARQPESLIRRELDLQRGRQFNPDYVDAMLACSLIEEIVQAESQGATLLSAQQIRQVLDGNEPTP